MTQQERTSKALHDLVATCNDAAEGFAKAAKGVHETDLSNWLATASDEREEFAADITRALTGMGEEPRADLHEGGILRKGWVDLEGRLRSTEPHLHSKDDMEIVRECIAGDSNTVAHYDHALSQSLPDEVRSLVLQQRTRVQDQLSYLQSKATRHHSQTA